MRLADGLALEADCRPEWWYRWFEVRESPARDYGTVLHQRLADEYARHDPSLATGAALDAICELTGTIRRQPGQVDP